MVKELGAKVYRFSLSWPRIIPTGIVSNVNNAGIQYYSDLIDELLLNDITPVVTIYHWDLPQRLQEMVFEHFGDRVKIWTTFNKPRLVCKIDFDEEHQYFSPLSIYHCCHNIIKAHAEAYHMYKKDFQHTQHGKIGISIDSLWLEPEDDEDKEASEVDMQLYFGWFAHPIFSTIGNYS
ncbi:Glycoside hydrolase family 1 [Sergentomyia squamirostris]